MVVWKNRKDNERVVRCQYRVYEIRTKYIRKVPRYADKLKTFFNFAREFVSNGNIFHHYDKAIFYSVGTIYQTLSSLFGVVGIAQFRVAVAQCLLVYGVDTYPEYPLQG